METFELDPDLFTKRGAGDDKLYVTFYPGITHDPAASAEAGRPIYHDATYIRIIVPGDKTNIIDRPIRPEDKLRFPKQWAAFNAGMEGEAQTSGTRLKEWSLMPRSMAEQLAALKLFTVEQLAACRDDIVSNVPGLQTYKANAAAWLDQAKTTAEASKLTAALEEKDNQIGALSEALKDLQAQVMELRKTRKSAA